MKKLFIVGCGRSGTTMVQQALNRHSQIAISPETGYFIDFVGHSRKGQAQHLRHINSDLKLDLAAPRRRITRAREIIDFYDVVANAYLDRIGKADAVYFGDKSPRHLLKLPRIIRLFPDAKIILVYRDGRDVALSLSKVPWGPSDLYVNFAIWLRSFRSHRRAMQREGIDIHPLRYEDFVVNPEAELRRLSGFLELPYESEMALGHGNTEGIAEREFGWKESATRSITTERIGRWRTEMTPTQIQRVERWGGTALASLGYELTTGGTQPLPIGFFPRLYFSQTAWRVGVAWRLARKNLLGA